jgi:hypothetical protein
VFTGPDAAQVGVTEHEAAARKGGRVAYLPMREVDRAMTASRTASFIKIIAGPGRGLGNAGGVLVLGATIVAGRAGEMINEVARSPSAPACSLAGSPRPPTPSRRGPWPSSRPPPSFRQPRRPHRPARPDA